MHSFPVFLRFRLSSHWTVTGVWDPLLELAEHTVYWPEAADFCTELVSFMWLQQVPASQKLLYCVLLNHGSARNVR